MQDQVKQHRMEIDRVSFKMKYYIIMLMSFYYGQIEASKGSRPRLCAGNLYICGSMVGPSTHNSAKSGSLGEDTRRTAFTQEDFPTPFTKVRISKKYNIYYSTSSNKYIHNMYVRCIY